MGCIITGCGKAAPKLVVTNDDLAHLVDTDDAWIVQRTGIRTRRIAQGESATDLAVAAAEAALGIESGNAMERSGWRRPASGSKAVDPASIDLVICMTISPDAAMPSQAALVRRRLGAQRAVCFDLNAACSGCVYGLSVAESMMAAANAPGSARNPLRRALVIGVERLSRVVDWSDRSTCILFGDGAGAVLLEWSDAETGIRSTFLKNTDDADGVLTLGTAHRESLPSLFDALAAEQALPARPADSATAGFGECADQAPENAFDPQSFPPHIAMSGQAVFRFATAAVVEAIEEACGRAGASVGEVDLIVPHQANERIIRYAAKKLGLPMERFQLSIESSANTSAASALMALTDALVQERLRVGDTAVMVGFGGGLTAGSVLFHL
ncbi:MAG: beta-ketoacyl-ACP synthase 3 [Berryella intestinalis]|uniref:beta-ketoacyl-ACP synthase 3 n=1 Tax=Berryella intestinalis TaxID=1531429 RepID=UPI002A517D25|nr:beta-ketoacyl-ACP synthase 3 [Berryella intestinalis]MDD7369176.1 beta-ketoacyl-ACP synthase 3 [Berryella intestinalis]MDY3129420.1 beta-ketoacyl-ACP synthase 3 [Berryella intestinalis]